MADDYKERAEEFVNKVDEFAKGKLNNAEDIVRITELVFKAERKDVLEEMSFDAKYAQGLLKIIRGRDNKLEDDYFEKIKAEYTFNVKKVQSHLKKLLDEAKPFLQNIYNEKYFSLTHQGLNNLNMLIDDLSWVKMYLNHLKRNNN